jgi:hypothetical protein
LKKQFGGASEDVKHREGIFEKGMPEKGKKPFYKGIDIEAKLRQMKQEWTEIVEMCPLENRDTYQYAKESELVKICLKHLRHSEYDQAVKELLNEIKFDRKLERAINGDGADDEEANVEDGNIATTRMGGCQSLRNCETNLSAGIKNLNITARFLKMINPKSAIFQL